MYKRQLLAKGEVSLVAVNICLEGFNPAFTKASLTKASFVNVSKVVPDLEDVYKRQILNRLRSTDLHCNWQDSLKTLQRIVCRSLEKQSIYLLKK